MAKEQFSATQDGKKMWDKATEVLSASKWREGNDYGIYTEEFTPTDAVLIVGENENGANISHIAIIDDEGNKVSLSRLQGFLNGDKLENLKFGVISGNDKEEYNGNLTLRGGSPANPKLRGNQKKVWEERIKGKTFLVTPKDGYVLKFGVKNTKNKSEDQLAEWLHENENLSLKTFYQLKEKRD